MNVLAAVTVILVVASVLGKTEGVDYIVGDSTGWRVPPATKNFYSTWASGKNFTVGDVMVFNFTTGEHNLGVITKDGYENCDVGDITLLLVSGPATIPLVDATEYYFICQFPDHCSGGQKLEIKVSTSTNTTSTPPPPPPPPSSYASSVAATLLMAVLSIATSTVLF